MKGANYDAREIAQEVGVSPKTVRRHLYKLRNEAKEKGFRETFFKYFAKKYPNFGIHLELG